MTTLLTELKEQLYAEECKIDLGLGNSEFYHQLVARYNELLQEPEIQDSIDTLRIAEFLGIKETEILKVEKWWKIIFVKYRKNNRIKVTFISRALFESEVQNGEIKKLNQGVYQVTVCSRLTQIWSKGQHLKTYIWVADEQGVINFKQWSMENYGLIPTYFKDNQIHGNFNKLARSAKKDKRVKTLRGLAGKGFEIKVFDAPVAMVKRLVTKWKGRS